MAALMNSVQGNLPRIAKYINHCKRDLSIEILPPDINVGTANFIPLKGNKIIFSLNAKYVGEDVLKAIIEEREKGLFTSFDDFIMRTGTILNRNTIEALGSIGAFDNFGIKRSQIVASFDDIMDKLSKIKQAMQRASKVGKDSSFKTKVGQTVFSEFIPDIVEFPDNIKYRLEKKYIGIYLSGNPLFSYSYAIKENSNFKTTDINYSIEEDTGFIILDNQSISNRKAVSFIGIIDDIKIMTTKAKKEQMAIMQVEDLEGRCKMIMWAGNYADNKDILKPDEVFKIEGYLKIDTDDVPSVICTRLSKMDEAFSDRVVIYADDASEIPEIKKILKNNMVLGFVPTYVVYNNLRILLDKKYWLNKDKIELSLFKNASMEKW